MKFLTGIFWGILLGCLPINTALGNEPALKSIEQQLILKDTYRGTFEQSKSIRILKAPIQSSGQFILSRQHGIYWHTTKPVSSELLLDEKRIVQRLSDGSAQSLEVDGNPQFALFNRVFFQLFFGQYALLGEHFSIANNLTSDPVSQSKNNKTWSLTLTPRHSELATLFKQIDIYGQSYIQSLTLYEANGDRTSITLHIDTKQHQALTASELSLFHP